MILIGGGVLIWLLRPTWAEATLNALNEDSLNTAIEFVRGFGWWAPVISIGLTVLQTIIVPLPGQLIATANGAIFGVWWGTVISWIGGMLGGALAFTLGRSFGAPLIERWFKGNNNQWIERINRTNPFWVILLARLIPGLSFDIISYVAGLSRITMRDYLVATGIGIIPGTLAFNLFGQEVLETEQNGWLIALLLVLGVAGLIFGHWWYRRWEQETPTVTGEPAPKNPSE